MNRRAFLAATAAAVSSLAAGCNSFPTATQDQTATTNSTTGPPPYFEAVQITGPGRVTVGEPFHVEITARNTGGRPGDFIATLTVNADALLEQVRSVRIPSIPVGETRQVRLGPLHARLAADVAFEITDHAASHRTSVDPIVVHGYGPASLPGGLRVAWTELELTNALHTTGGGGPGVVTPDAGRVYATGRLGLANQAADALPVPSLAAFALAGDGSGTAGTGDPDARVQPLALDQARDDLALDPPPLPLVATRDLPAGETLKGSLVFAPAAGVVEAGLWPVYDRDLGGRPEVTWEPGPLARGGRPPAFELNISESEPLRARSGKTLPTRLQIANQGDLPGVYRDVLRLRAQNAASSTRRQRLELRIPAGETGTVETDLQLVDVGRHELRLAALDAQVPVRVRPARRALGDSYRMPWGTSIQVGGLHLPREIMTRESIGDRSTTRSSRKFALVRVACRLGDRRAPYPRAGDFEVRTGDGGRYPAVAPPGGSERVKLVGPVEGDFYELVRPSGEQAAGSGLDGWLLFEIPRRYSFGDVRVRWVDGREVSRAGAEWARDRT